MCTYTRDPSPFKSLRDPQTSSLLQLPSVTCNILHNLYLQSLPNTWNFHHSSASLEWKTTLQWNLFIIQASSLHRGYLNIVRPDCFGRICQHPDTEPDSQRIRQMYCSCFRLYINKHLVNPSSDCIQAEYELFVPQTAYKWLMK